MKTSKDPLFRIAERRRKQNDDWNKMLLKARQRVEDSQRKVTDIRLKAHASMYKLWNKRWDKED